MILKCQNAQLTKHNDFLNEVVASNKKIILEVDHVLNDLSTMCKNLDSTKFE